MMNNYCHNSNEIKVDDCRTAVTISSLFYMVSPLKE